MPDEPEQEEIRDEPEVQPEPETTSDSSERFKFTSYRPKATAGFLTWTGRVLAVLVIIVAVGLLGRQIHHHYATHTNPAGAAGAAPAQPSATTTKKATVSSKKHTTTKTTSSVPNTGPGNTVALFAGVSLLAAGVHYAAAAKKQSA